MKKKYNFLLSFLPMPVLHKHVPTTIQVQETYPLLVVTNKTQLQTCRQNTKIFVSILQWTLQLEFPYRYELVRKRLDYNFILLFNIVKDTEKYEIKFIVVNICSNH